MNPEQYKVMLETFLRVELHVSKFCCVSNKMEQLLKQQKFPCRSSGQHFWADSFLVFRTSTFPACWPDHGVPDYFLYVKSRVYGVGVACWPLIPKLAGSNPAEAVGFLGRKNPQDAFLRRGSKVVGPMS